MNVRLENIQTEVLPGNYVSFLGSAPKSKGRPSDADSIHSVSSVRSVMSSMSSMWSRFNLTNETTKQEKQKAVEQEDLKYLYSAFTKIPCLRLAPDHRSKLIAGYEEFPFDTAVPLFAFKNLSALEICDLDFRQLYGWDRLAEQLRSLTIKRGSVDDISDLLINVVLDDADRRRRRSSKPQGPSSPAIPWPAASPTSKQAELSGFSSTPASPLADARRTSVGSPQSIAMVRGGSSEGRKTPRTRQRSQSPVRPVSSRHNSSYAHPRSNTPKFRRSSGSSSSSIHSSTPRNSTSNLLSLGNLHAAKWRFLKHLSLADNALTFISASSLAPLTSTLHSLDLSSNLFNEIPDCLATLSNLRALNLSNCMIHSLHSLARNPLPAINIINLRSNRLSSLAGVERLFSLEKIDLRDNRLSDPAELARLTRIPDIQHVYVAKNPFVRTHANYRLTIFNLFRASPGYTEDVLIDGTGPSYTERRQLIDRVPETLGLPIIRAPTTDDSDYFKSPARSIQTDAEEGQPEQGRSPEHPRRPEAERANTSQRRRKGTRRRIVELSEQEPTSPPPRQLQAPNVPNLDPATPLMPPPALPADRSVYHTAQSKLEPPVLSPLDTGVESPSPTHQNQIDLSENVDSPTIDPEDVSDHGDIYRQKIEALKNDFGNGWLTALSEDKWDRRSSANDRDFSPVRTIKPTRADSKGVSVSGRTLG